MHIICTPAFQKIARSFSRHVPHIMFVIGHGVYVFSVTIMSYCMFVFRSSPLPVSLVWAWEGAKGKDVQTRRVSGTFFRCCCGLVHQSDKHFKM